MVNWLLKVWATNTYSVEDLADSDSMAYVTLDLKLAVALQHMILHGGNPAKELQDQVNRKMEESAKQGGLIEGRQIVKLLLLSFKTFDNAEIVYGFDHLAKLECGSELYLFVTQWTNILENMNGGPPTANLRDVFYRKIQDHKDLTADINIYNRLREDHPNRSYKWLMDIVMQEVTLRRERRNMADREASIVSLYTSPSPRD